VDSVILAFSKGAFRFCRQSQIFYVPLLRIILRIVHQILLNSRLRYEIKYDVYRVGKKLHGFHCNNFALNQFS